MTAQGSKAVILAGGKGARFRPYSFTIPKPLMPIGEDPIMLHLINQLRDSGVSRVLVALGYQAELVKAYFGDGSRLGVSIRYYQEDAPLGTAGPLSLMADEFAPGEYFFLVNGDIHTELDFRRLRGFAERSGCDIVVGCVERVEQSSFGVLGIENGSVTGIVEKPENRFHISAGIYALNGRAAARVPSGRPFTVPDLVKTYVAEGRRVAAFPIHEFWLGIENADNLETVLKRVQAKRRPSAEG
jgi:NDP-sugar pyrophosphorylase family protein